MESFFTIYLFYCYYTYTPVKRGQLTVQVLTLTFIGNRVCAVWYLDTLNTVTIAVQIHWSSLVLLSFQVFQVESGWCNRGDVGMQLWWETCFQQPRPADYGTGLSFPFVFFEYSYILHHMCSTGSWLQGLSTSRGPWKGQNANQCTQIWRGTAWSGLHGNGV